MSIRSSAPRGPRPSSFGAPARRELAARLSKAGKAVAEGARLWICYPKAGQLGTELNRDLLHGLAAEAGWDAVRQIALDEVWSALAFKRRFPWGELEKAPT